MISKYNRLKSALAITDKRLQEFCNEIGVSRHTVRRYFKGELERENYYLDLKLEELWQSAMHKLEQYQKWEAINKY